MTFLLVLIGALNLVGAVVAKKAPGVRIAAVLAGLACIGVWVLLQ